MGTNFVSKDKIHLADLLANERTFLAWIRTAVSIIAFGFVIIKFLLPGTSTDTPLTEEMRRSLEKDALFTGISFVIMGGTISTLAYVRYLLTGKQIVTGSIQSSFSLPALLIIAVVIICVMLIIYFLKHTSL